MIMQTITEKKETNSKYQTKYIACYINNYEIMYIIDVFLLHIN